MKKLALIVLAAVATVAASWGAATVIDSHYQKYQNKQVQAQQAKVDRETKLANDLVTEQGTNKKLTSENGRLQAECEKGRVAYESLTPFAQKTKARPLCSAAGTQ